MPPTGPHPGGATLVRTAFGIREYRLGNGLQVLLFPDDTRSTITVNMTYFVGSRHEGYGETGMAHLLEHLTFKSTPRYGDLLAALDAHGADANASTDYDRTNYFETLPASDANLAFALGVEAERMQHAALRAQDLATELAVVENELEMGENDPAQVLLARVMSTAYLWHAYGRAVIGERSDVEHVPIAQLRAFYQRWYQPDDAMLVVAGKLDPDATLVEVERSFGAIPRPTRALPRTYTLEPVQDGERTVTLRRAGHVHLIDIAYHIVAGADPDFAAIDAAADLLTREPSGRLYAPLVGAHLASSIGGYGLELREPGLVVFDAEVPDGKDVAAVEQQMTAAIEGLGATTIGDDEVERYRADTLRDLDLRSADSEGLAIELSEWAAMGDWRLLFAYRDRVKALTAADVRRAAATWFKQSNRTIGEFVPTATPDRAPLPERPDVDREVARIHAPPVVAGEAFVASLDHLIARTRFSHPDAGLSAALLPKKTRGGAVRLSLTLHFGDLDSLRGKAGLGAATAAMCERGTTQHDFAQLEDAEARLRADIDLTGDDDSVTVTIATVRDSLLPAIDLALEMLEHPAFGKDQLDVVRADQLAHLAEEADDPGARAFLALARAMAPYPDDDPRALRDDDAETAWWKQLTIDDVKSFHRDFFGAGHGELVVIGDFDADAVTAEVTRGLAGWTTAHPWKRLPEQRFAVAGRTITVSTPDKEQAVVAVGHDLALGDGDADYPAAVLASYVLGGSSNSRLWKRLREHDGFSYETSSWIDASAFDEVGSFGADAIMAPADLPRAEAALLEELRRFAKDGVAADELAAMKQAWLDQDAAALSDDDALADELGELLVAGRDLGWLKSQRAAIEQLTAAQVSAAARTYLEPDRLIVVEAGDLAAKPK